jgi:hypothetical protein
MRYWLSLLLALATVPVFAAEQLGGDQIAAVLSDKSLYGEQNGAKIEQIFQQAGTTFYLVNGASSVGQWQVRGNQYCSLWPPNPTWTCFDVFEDAATVIFKRKDRQTYVMQKLP